MIRRTRWSALALAAASLTACTDSGDAPSALAKESPALQCPTDGLSDVPAECILDDDGFDPSPAPASTVSAPSSSAAIPAVQFDRQPGDLAVGGNDEDPTKQEQVFTVTVAAGARLSVSVACRGFAEMDVTTEPKTLAEVTLPCGDVDPVELTVLDPELLEAPVTYRVTVTSPAPSRWYVALGSVTEPAATS